MRTFVKLTGIACFGLSLLMTPVAFAQTANPLPPLPGPFQMMMQQQPPVQMQQRLGNNGAPQTNWANNAQRLPYWMQKPAESNGTVATPAPAETGTQSGNAQASQNQTMSAQNGVRWFGQAATSATNMMGGRNTTTPGNFPGYTAAPTGQNTGRNGGQNAPARNRNSQPANGQQFRPTNNNWGRNMPNFGPSYGQVMPNWGGFNPGFFPSNGRQYGQQYAPPNGYGYPPGYGPYGPAPRR